MLRNRTVIDRSIVGRNLIVFLTNPMNHSLCRHDLSKKLNGQRQATSVPRMHESYSIHYLSWRTIVQGTKSRTQAYLTERVKPLSMLSDFQTFPPFPSVLALFFCWPRLLVAFLPNLFLHFGGTHPLLVCFRHSLDMGIQYQQTFLHNLSFCLC